MFFVCLDPSRIENEQQTLKNAHTFQETEKRARLEAQVMAAKHQVPALIYKLHKRVHCKVNPEYQFYNVTDKGEVLPE